MPHSFLKTIWSYKWLFAFLFIGIFGTFLLILSALGLVPSEIRDNPIAENQTVPIPNNPDILPTHITIPKIGVDTVVQNPQTQDVKLLDEALLKGSVRYPGSGTIGKGNMFLFAHSTGFRVVHNQAFKAFNNLKDLKTGDDISIQSGSDTYIYRVSKVTLVDSTKALVEFNIKKNMLTLSTCNTFGEKSERYVVEAEYIGKTENK